MARFGKGFVASMEDDGDEIEVSEGLPAELHAEAAEIDKTADNITSDIIEADDAAADADTLDDIADVAEDSLTNGDGMDPVSAEIAEVAVEAIYNRLGIKRRSIPSLESFGSQGNRKTATRVAMEDWRDSVKKVYESIKKFFNNLWLKIKAFIARTIEYFSGIESACKSMEKRIDAFASKNLHLDEKSFENDSISDAFTSESSGVTFERVKTLIETVGREVDNGEKTLAPLVVASNQLVGPDTAAVVLAYRNSIVKISVPGKGLTIYGKKLTIEKEKGTLSASMVEDKKEPKGGKITTLSAGQMTILNGLVAANSKIVARAEASFKSIEDVSKAAEKRTSDFIDRLGNRADDGTAAERQTYQEAKDALLCAKGTNSILTRTFIFTVNCLSQTSRAVLSYINVSMEQYKDEKKKK